MNKYLARLKSEKPLVDALPKLPKGQNNQVNILPKLTKGGYGSYVSAEGRHISEKNILSIRKAPTISIPQWQHDFCLAHAVFNNWRGCCPYSIDECLISKILDSNGHVDNLRGLEIGQGVTTDMVIDNLIEANEPVDSLFSNPAWWVCLAESL